MLEAIQLILWIHGVSITSILKDLLLFQYLEGEPGKKEIEIQSCLRVRILILKVPDRDGKDGIRRKGADLDPIQVGILCMDIGIERMVIEPQIASIRMENGFLLKRLTKILIKAPNPRKRQSISQINHLVHHGVRRKYRLLIGLKSRGG